MIKDAKPLSMAEAVEYIGDGKDSNEAEVRKFVKKFISMKPEKAKELREKLEGLDLIKMKPEHVVKIIDVMPDDAENLNKIFTDVGLDEDEVKKILETIKEYK